MRRMNIDIYGVVGEDRLAGGEIPEGEKGPTVGSSVLSMVCRTHAVCSSEQGRVLLAVRRPRHAPPRE